MIEYNSHAEVTITVDERYTVEQLHQLMLEVEAAGLIECSAMGGLNMIMGKIARMYEAASVLATIESLPGVETVDRSTIDYSVR